MCGFIRHFFFILKLLFLFSQNPFTFPRLQILRSAAACINFSKFKFGKWSLPFLKLKTPLPKMLIQNPTSLSLRKSPNFSEHQNSGTSSSLFYGCPFHRSPSQVLIFILNSMRIFVFLELFFFFLALLSLFFGIAIELK